MNRILTLVTTLFIVIVIASNAHAVRNPFLPQLPIEVIKIEPIVEPVEEPTEQTEEPVVQPAQPTQPSMPTVITPKEPPKPPVVFPPFKISGVIWNSDQPQAIINDMVVSEGDLLEGVKIEMISQSAIKLSYQGVERTIAP